MAQGNQERIYQVKGADGLYHSVPESRLEQFHQRQEELRKAGKTGLPPLTQESKDRLSRLKEAYQRKKSSEQQNQGR